MAYLGHYPGSSVVALQRASTNLEEVMAKNVSKLLKSKLVAPDAYAKRIIGDSLVRVRFAGQPVPKRSKSARQKTSATANELLVVYRALCQANDALWGARKDASSSEFAETWLDNLNDVIGKEIDKCASLVRQSIPEREIDGLIFLTILLDDAERCGDFRQ
jgi:hypothetical protein